MIPKNTIEINKGISFMNVNYSSGEKIDKIIYDIDRASGCRYRLAKSTLSLYLRPIRLQIGTYSHSSQNGIVWKYRDK